PCPSLAGVAEGAEFLIAQEPGDFGHLEPLLLQISLGETVTEILQDPGKADVFRGQTPAEGAPADAETLSDRLQRRLPVREQGRDRILDPRLPVSRCDAASR